MKGKAVPVKYVHIPPLGSIHQPPEHVGQVTPYHIILTDHT